MEKIEKEVLVSYQGGSILSLASSIIISIISYKKIINLVRKGLNA